MSTYKTPKGNTVDINWRNHNNTAPGDIDYLLDQVDAFVDATRASRNQIDNIAVVYNVTKNRPRKVKPAPKEDPPEKSTVTKLFEKVTGKKTASKKKVSKKKK